MLHEVIPFCSFRDESCSTPTNYTLPANVSTFGPCCSCGTGAQVCPEDSGKPDPPSFLVSVFLTSLLQNKNYSFLVLYLKSHI